MRLAALIVVIGPLGLAAVGCANPPPLEGENAGSGGSGGTRDGGGIGGGGSLGSGGRGGAGGSLGTGGRADAGPAAMRPDGGTRSVVCSSTAEITVGAFARVGTSFDPGVDALYAAPVMSPQLGTNIADEVDIQFVQLDDLLLNGAMTGGFDLVNDSVPFTCSRCVKILVDDGANEFQAQSGVLSISGASPVGGTLDATLTDVTLSLVGGQPLPGSTCLHIGSATAHVTM